MPAKAVITIEDVNHALEVLNKIYDSVRFVRPQKKKMINFEEGKLSEAAHSCYDYWAQGKVCSNCISMRAFNEGDIFLKLSWIGNKIYMVTAVPVQNTDETVILELIKDVTNSITIDLPESMKNNFLLQALNEIGQLQIKDSLTGIFNRRFIDERLQVDIFNRSVDFIPLSIIFADIDHFKLINDTYGHIAGDHVLNGFAALLQKSVTSGDDWVARYGGEEFLILLRNTNMASAVEFAERLRSNVENSTFEFEGNHIKITSSFGICSLQKNLNIKAEELMENVDRNLYEAKSGGRNKVVATEV